MKIKIIPISLVLLLFSILTVLTQVGGVIYLLSLLLHKYVHKWTENRVSRAAYKCALFLTLYCLATFLVVPGIAKSFG